jgi:uncharacterized membrane protein YphA (DoxX/SURF4 family)
MRTVALGQGLLAIASASLAIWSLAYGDFAWGGQSLFAGIPWRETWVNGSALIILAASAGVCFSRTAVPSMLIIGAYQAIGIAISIPQILSTPLGVGAWYPFCEALTPLVGAWVLYAMLRRESRKSVTPIAGEAAVRAAQVLFGLTWVFYGWSHFVYAEYTASLVPTFLPGRLAFAYFTGLGHVAAGLAVIVGILPRLAATLEAIMMSLFGLLVWVPSFFAHPRPKWATPPEHQWSELAVNVVLAASAWIIAISLGNRSWTFASRSRVQISLP